MNPPTGSCIRQNNGLAPGFRFHPTDEELVVYYLKRKIRRKKLIVDAIGDVDVYKYDPEDLPGKALYKSRDLQWFFFSKRDKKHGGRSSRGTVGGYWKATGNDRVIKCNSRPVGEKKTLVFHRGRAPKGERTNWVMHEYTLHHDELKRCGDVKDSSYVVYKIYKKSGSGPKNGEQYGAPFIEEEWSDDEDVVDDGVVDVPVNQFIAPGNDIWVNGVNQSELDGNDIEELLRQVIEEPGYVRSSLAPPLQTSEDAYLEIDDLLLSEPEAEPGSFDQGQSGVVNDNDFFDVDSYFPDLDATIPEFEQSVEVNTSAVTVTVQVNNNQSQQQVGKNNNVSNWQPLCDSYMTRKISNDGLTGTGEFVNPLKGEEARKDESSQFASNLWDFLKDIPANPAFASEVPFVNLKYKFSASKTTTSNTVVVAKRNSKGFFCLSIIGALCALFWVVVGTMGGVSGRSLLW